MPASTCEPINSALRHALSSERASDGGHNLETRMIVSAKSVLNSHIEFEQSDTYKSTVLDNLKSKYTVLGAETEKNGNESPAAESANNKHDENLLPEPKHTLFPLKSVKLGWSENGWHTGVGMYNTGNTCYLNSTLQALFHVPALINWLVSDREHRNNCENSCMVCAVAKTLLSSQTQSQQPIRPWMISSKLRTVCRHLVPGQQEDAHEFLRYLVEAMERAYIQRFRIENLDARSKETTPLNQIFGGYLRSAVRCLQCGYVSTTVQHFQDLLLDIRKVSTLDDALTSFFASERLDDLAYKCESCHRKVSAVKQFSLERAPSVLCIQLKRFAGTSGKITRHVNFRQRLELTQFSHRKPATPLKYKLTALVTHMGMSVNCGHYTAIGLTPSGNYYEFDDSSVRSVSPQIVLSTNAYIMFYELEADSRQTTPPSTEVKSSAKAKTLETTNSPIQTNGHRTSPSKTITTINTNTALTPFKNNMIPTQVRNKTLVNLTKSETESSATKIQTKLNCINGTLAITDGKHDKHDGKKSDNSMPSLSPINKTNGNITETKKPVEISKNGLTDKGAKTETPSGVTNGFKNGNGVKSSDKPKVNGFSRSLVPYESDGGSSSTSESENAPSGKWLISSTTKIESPRTPSLNGDTGWGNKIKPTMSVTNNLENKTSNQNGSSTVSQLMRMSHSGYSSSVVSWSGNSSSIDKEIASERRETFKRQHSDVDEIDRGRAKKQRTNNMNNNNSRSNPGYNAFQEYQQSNNRSWNNTSFRPKHYYNNNQRFRRRFFPNNKQQHRFHR